MVRIHNRSDIIQNTTINKTIGNITDTKTGCYSVTYISLVFDWIGVGHAGWLLHYAYRYFFMKNMDAQPESEKPAIQR